MAAPDDGQGEFLGADIRLSARCRDVMRLQPKRQDCSMVDGKSQTLEAAVEAVIEGNQMMDRSVRNRARRWLLPGSRGRFCRSYCSTEAMPPHRNRLSMPAKAAFRPEDD